MEIEAKFQVPDVDTFNQLLTVSTLAGFSLGPSSMCVLYDTYLDTADGALRKGGFACRLRRQDGRYLATLKGLGAADGAIHRRIEHEVELPERVPLPGWPPSAARDLAIGLCGEAPLISLFEIHQTRFTRLVAAAGRGVAELNLDRVSVHFTSQAGGSLDAGRETLQRSGPLPAEFEPDDAAVLPAEEYLELEVELLPDGGDQQLEAIVSDLQGTWRLVPDGRSKFERALDLAGAGYGVSPEAEADVRPHLSPEERTLIERLAGERAVIARRARLLLAWDDGLSVTEMVERSGLSARRARHWRWLFRHRRLAIFPARWLRAYQAAAPVSPAKARKAVKAAAVKMRAPGGPPPEVGSRTKGEEAAALLRAAELPKRPGIEPQDPMTEAGRKALGFHFRRMLHYEPGTRTGEDIEALHDMRVATRRMRAAFRTFEEYFDPKVVAPLLKGLRRTGRSLGAVRDLDVFRDKVLAYRETLQEPHAGGLDDFLGELEAQRGAARERLIAYLDGDGYRSFVELCAKFVERQDTGRRSSAPGGDEPRPYRVRDVVPMAIYERLAAVRAYDEWVLIPDPPLTRLHALRIACKRLRYTLEFFQEVLGPETKVLVRDAVAVQDHLGLVQDGVVASGILRDYLVWGTWGPEVSGKRLRGSRMPLIAPAVVSYLALRQSEIQELVAGFPVVWSCIIGPEYSRGVAAAVSVL